MSFGRLFAFPFIALFLNFVAMPSYGAETAKAPLSLEEVKSKRLAARQELMIPSLQGIRGLSYRVVGYKDAEPLDKAMAEKLVHLGVPTVRFFDMKEGQKPVDAIVQITFLKAGAFDVAELTAMQWVSLLRDPKLKVRAITYKSREIVPHGKPAAAVEALTDEFVIDFLKANKNATTPGDNPKATPLDEDGQTKKDKKSDSKSEKKSKSDKKQKQSKKAD